MRFGLAVSDRAVLNWISSNCIQIWENYCNLECAFVSVFQCQCKLLLNGVSILTRNKTAPVAGATGAGISALLLVVSDP